ncbi:hypothetical protein [Cognatitamlana onchidii]|uniref:hypothetical protein n=1 Tax=Cognatitamlana onchidii TaxID=2562860 RepID=UPI0010A6808C|nr:hypothetical protein [Algibacter onchidii]
MKTIPWSHVLHAETRTYNAISEYGGWGLKGGSFYGNKGLAVNVKGNIGIQLILKDQKKLLLGTQKKMEADLVISRYLHKT